MIIRTHEVDSPDLWFMFGSWQVLFANRSLVHRYVRFRQSHIQTYFMFCDPTVAPPERIPRYLAPAHPRFLLWSHCWNVCRFLTRLMISSSRDSPEKKRSSLICVERVSLCWWLLFSILSNVNKSR